MSYRPILISAVFLFLFAIIGRGLVAYTFDSTAERIADNQRRALLKSLNELVPRRPLRQQYLSLTYSMCATANCWVRMSRCPSTGRARMAGRWLPCWQPVAPDGYNGSIRLLVAIRLNGKLAGVRVIQHRETPGLGDGIEAERSDWILGFNGKSLLDPARKHWKVRRDGGTFDQFTGATITPRAVVKAVKKALLYYRSMAHTLFDKPNEKPLSHDAL